MPAVMYCVIYSSHLLSHLGKKISFFENVNNLINLLNFIIIPNGVRASQLLLAGQFYICR